MSLYTPDIVIFGGGIAGLWAFHRYKSIGYDTLLLESTTIGGGQTIASQGIIHSGLKYAFAGKVNKLAQGISAMQDLWTSALHGDGDVDLSAAKTLSNSQYLMMNNKVMGEIIKLITRQALGNNVHEIKPEDWPQEIKKSGFKGKVVFMDEPVLDIPSVLRALAEPFKDSIRKIETPDDPFGFLDRHGIEPKQIVFTSAASNAEIATKAKHNAGLETQVRPLLMGMLKPAPYPLFAHLVGHSDKPVASITTHTTREGELVWYLGGGAAERSKDANPKDGYDAVRNGFSKYIPNVDLSDSRWAALPIDRIEGKSGIDGWMPDTPTIHSQKNTHYCWPTKLTFAPLLTQRLLDKMNIQPSGTQSDWSFLPEVGYSETPWDEAHWTDGN